MESETSDKPPADGQNATSWFLRRNSTAAAAIVMCLAAGALPVLGQDAVQPSPSPAMTGQAADDGARIVQVEILSPRARDLTIESPAVGTAQVRRDTAEDATAATAS